MSSSSAALHALRTTQFCNMNGSALGPPQILLRKKYLPRATGKKPLGGSPDRRISPDQPEPDRLAAARSGDPDQFYAAVQPYERLLFLSAVAIVKDETEAEDIVQEAMLKAFRHIGGFRGDSKLSTWLVQIVMNEARLKLRRERRIRCESLDEIWINETGEHSPREIPDRKETPSKALENKQLRARLRVACDALSPPYRQVFLLREVGQLSVQETAEALGINRAMVRSRLFRARLRMRQMLSDLVD